jgi:hypothetical protein
MIGGWFSPASGHRFYVKFAPSLDRPGVHNTGARLILVGSSVLIAEMADSRRGCDDRSTLASHDDNGRPSGRDHHVGR